MSPVDPMAVAQKKAALRTDLLARRRRLKLGDLVDNAAALSARTLAVPEVARAATVAACVSVGREPGTGGLLDEPVARGHRVLLPVLRRDGDLDWCRYTDSDALTGVSRFERLRRRLAGKGSIVPFPRFVDWQCADSLRVPVDLQPLR